MFLISLSSSLLSFQTAEIVCFVYRESTTREKILLRQSAALLRKRLHCKLYGTSSSSSSFYFFIKQFHKKNMTADNTRTGPTKLAKALTVTPVKKKQQQLLDL